LDQLGPDAANISEEEWDLALRTGMGLEDIQEALNNNESLGDLWRRKEQEIQDWLKRFGLTEDDLQVMLDNDISLPDYQIMQELGMEPREWAMAMLRLGSPEAIWEAAQYGYDPITMTPAQMAAFSLKTDVNVQAVKLWEQLPDRMREGLPPGASVALSNEYADARMAARARGEVLDPRTWLRSEYPGLFGGGTGAELRQDFERLGTSSFIERPYGAGVGGYRTMRGGGGPSESITSVNALPGFFREGFGGATYGSQPPPAGGPRPGLRLWAAPGIPTAEGEMILMRQFAQLALTNPRIGTPEQKAQIGKRYPGLTRRAEAGEFETAEQKRKRLQLKQLQGAGRG